MEEPELESLLLEAAGRTDSAGRNQQSRPSGRRRVQGSYSDDGSESRDEDSDYDEEYTSMDPSNFQKKRSNPDERENDRDMSEDDESDIGSDLYKNEYDRQELSKLPEFDREYILSERAAKIDDKRLQETVRSKRTSHPKNETPVLRSSSRYADRAAAKDGALNELRAKRLKQQHPEKRRDALSPKRKSFSLTSSSQSDSEEESIGEGSAGDGDMLEHDTPTFEDIKEITVRRSKLAKWLMEPFFDELIEGCFVRVGIGKSRTGPIYRLCVVRNVDASDPDKVYKVETRSTYKYLNCVWGDERSAARWQMAMVSDSLPVEEEFDQWVKEVKRAGGKMPSKQDVLKKKDAIEQTRRAGGQIREVQEKKSSVVPRPLNIATERERLRREMGIAESNLDEAEVERIRARIQQLEATRQAQAVDAKAMRLAEMNRKNRAENFRIASEAKRLNPDVKAGEAGYDPFSRRWTRSRNYYAKPGEGDDAATGGNGAAVRSGNVAQMGVAATAAALEAAADAGKLVDTCAPVDGETEWNALHNFDLPISLAVLQRFGGPQGVQQGFLARKQRIEATIGRRVPEDDGRRHPQTLTVADYIRRRGLL